MADNNETTNLDLLAIGDASLDMFMTPSESEALCQVSDKESLICFSYGDKIPVKSLEFSVGGNAANNAVGLSRLGIKTGIVITLGDDNNGKQILDTLTKERVDTTIALVEPESASNFSSIINYSGERTIFTYHVPRVYKFPENIPQTPWVYLTSMGENFEDFYLRVYDFLKEYRDIKLGLNPGSWQLKAGVEKLKSILSVTYILFVNRQEAQKLTGIDSAIGNEKSLLDGLTDLGPKIAIITDGQNGCFAKNGSQYLKLGVLNIPVIERTGAGDAFGSACMGALIKGKPLEEALVWGMANSSSVISFVGSQKGLLHDSEIMAWLDKVRSSNLKVENL